jgi:hypothetical protein
VEAEFAAKCVQNWDDGCMTKYQIEERLNRLVGAGVTRFLDALGGRRETKVTGNLLFASGCREMICDNTGDAFVFDLKTGAVVAAIHDVDTITLYGSAGNGLESVPSPLRAWIKERQAGMKPPPKILFSAAYQPRTIKLESGGKYKVPPQREWEIDGLSYIETETPRTADLYIEGGVNLGLYSVNGKFDVTIQGKQTDPITVSTGSKVEVGDTRATVTVKETAQRY